MLQCPVCNCEVEKLYPREQGNLREGTHKNIEEALAKLTSVDKERLYAIYRCAGAEPHSFATIVIVL